GGVAWVGGGAWTTGAGSSRTSGPPLPITTLPTATMTASVVRGWPAELPLTRRGRYGSAAQQNPPRPGIAPGVGSARRGRWPYREALVTPHTDSPGSAVWYCASTVDPPT